MSVRRTRPLEMPPRSSLLVTRPPPVPQGSCPFSCGLPLVQLNYPFVFFTPHLTLTHFTEPAQSRTHERAPNYTQERLEAPTPTLPPVDCNMELHPDENTPQHSKERRQPDPDFNKLHSFLI